jgi:hypothetical protein
MKKHRVLTFFLVASMLLIAGPVLAKEAGQQFQKADVTPIFKAAAAAEDCKQAVEVFNKAYKAYRSCQAWLDASVQRDLERDGLITGRGYTVEANKEAEERQSEQIPRPEERTRPDIEEITTSLRKYWAECEKEGGLELLLLARDKAEEAVCLECNTWPESAAADPIMSCSRRAFLRKFGEAG